MKLRKFKILIAFFIILFQTFEINIKSEENKNLISEIKWEKFKERQNYKKHNWIKHNNKKIPIYSENINFKKNNNLYQINSLNRSLVFNNKIISPDVSWLVPPGFKWSKRYKFDGSVRGHNRRSRNEPFLGWNGGDAVGQFYYQPIHHNDFSLGLNMGVRSVYRGDADGGKTDIGEGLSLGFRADYALSKTSGFAFGAEQLLHLDNKTDTGRDIYLTLSKGWWRDNNYGGFPLDIATFGFATGKMAEGNIKGLCSDLLGGSGTEIDYERPLCWSPVFSLARVFNTKFSSFFEYNSKWFLVGSSISPFDTIPLRGTFAVQLSDHIENYKLNSFDELKWVFRLSLGF